MCNFEKWSPLWSVSYFRIIFKVSLYFTSICNMGMIFYWLKYVKLQWHIVPKFQWVILAGWLCCAVTWRLRLTDSSAIFSWWLLRCFRYCCQLKEERTWRFPTTRPQGWMSHGLFPPQFHLGLSLMTAGKFPDWNSPALPGRRGNGYCW